MLSAHKSNAFGRIFTWHIQRRLQRSFGGAHIVGVAQARAACAAGPVLFVANHTAFWDALVIVWLSNRVLPVDAYCWMDGANLARLPFFRLLGAFGVQAQSGMDAARGMAYAARLVRGPRRALWIFPQGRQTSIAQRPLGLHKGSTFLAQRVPGLCVIPVALRYEFAEPEHPWVHVAFGPPVTEHADASHEAALTALLDHQERAVRSPVADADAERLLWRREQAESGLATRLLVALSRWMIARSLPPSGRCAGAAAGPASASDGP